MLSNFGGLLIQAGALKTSTHILKRFWFSLSLKMTEKHLSTYEEAVYALNGLQSNAAVLQKARAERDVNAYKNLRDTERHLKTLGIQLSDLDSLNVIHIAGTKGKGSTCAFAESILRKHGFKTGFYSSPHLVSVNERIRLNGLPIDKALFTKYFWEVYNPLQQSLKDDERMPSYFMFLTIMAFYIFIKEQIQATIIEVGIGGLYDCTNILRKPVVVGMASLGIDHVYILGHTIADIAAQKAGIFKNSVPAFTVSQPKSAMNILCDKAKEIGCSLRLVPPLEVYDLEFPLTFPSPVLSVNASLALQLCKAWLERVPKGKPLVDSSKWTMEIDGQGSVPMAHTFPVKSEIREALESCVWPGRFQTIKGRSFTLYVDGAHTQQSIKYCTKWFQEASSVELKTLQRPVLRILLFNCTGERKAENLLDPLSDINFDLVVFSPNRKYITKDSSSDQSNFMVDPQQEMKQCITNKEIWCHLMRSLSENELSFATQSSASIIESNLPPTFQKESNTLLFCCLSYAVDWLVHRKSVQHCPLCDNSNSFDRFLEGDYHLQILVTGSLHLVGGVMALVGFEFQTDSSH